MSWNTPDPYSNPGKFGLTIIGAIDDPDACYSFDDLVVWQHEDGRLFWGTDAGCSCPSPFEDYDSLDDLTDLTLDSWDEFQAAVDGHCKPSNRPDENAADKTQLLAKVSKLLRGQAR